VEKPATTNAVEFWALVGLARVYRVFLMEAMWTRFQPIACAIKEIIDGGGLGDPVMIHADLSTDFDIESEWVTPVQHGRSSNSHIDIPETHRILDPKLGGGAILDL
jgi:predicted dehydrogenase